MCLERCLLAVNYVHSISVGSKTGDLSPHDVLAEPEPLCSIVSNPILDHCASLWLAQILLFYCNHHKKFMIIT